MHLSYGPAVTLVDIPPEKMNSDILVKVSTRVFLAAFFALENLENQHIFHQHTEVGPCHEYYAATRQK